MAYNTQEERLKVKGSEQITRDLKVNRDLFVNGEAKVGGNDVLTTADKTDNVVENSTDVLTSGGAYTALETKQDVLTFDNVPTQNSDNPVKSGGVYDALETKINLTEKGASNGVATLDSTGRVPYSQLPESAMEYQGTWDASTNTPTLADGVGTNGDFYVVSAGGTVNFGTVASPRNVTFYINDRVIYDGSTHQWARLPAGEVRSVNGHSGDVVLTASDVGAATSTDITNAVNALDVASAGGAGKYISAISETNGKISATATTMDTAPTASSTNAVTSGGVKTAIDNEATARNTAITNAINALDVTDTAVSGKYVSAVSETNGKISVTRADLPNLDTATSAKALSGYVTCTTAGNVGLKVVNVPGLTVTTGTRLVIYFENFNSVSSELSLNVNGRSGGIILNGEQVSSNNYKFIGYCNCYFNGWDWYVTQDSTAEIGKAGFAVKAGYTRSIAYCTTTMSSSNKVASSYDYKLYDKNSFLITFPYSNTAASALTLNVNNTGAKSIYINGTASSATNYTIPAGTYMCYYDGTKYMIDTEHAVPSARNASISDALFGYIGSTPHKLSATISGSDHDIIRLKDTSNNLSLDYAHAISADNAGFANVSGALTNIYDDSRTLIYNTLHLDSTNSTITHENQYTYFEFSNTILPHNYSIVLVPGSNGSYYFGLTIPAPTPGGISFIEISRAIITLSTSSSFSDTKCKFRQLDPNLNSMDINFINLT